MFYNYLHKNNYDRENNYDIAIIFHDSIKRIFVFEGIY